MKIKFVLFVLFTILVTFPHLAYSHCQIPCGIYDDSSRVSSMLEDVQTIRKSVKEMNLLSEKNDVQSKNQFVRWVNNKEKFAQKIIETISDYFLTQRVKADQKDYEKRLVKHHKVIVDAMKVKQNSSEKFVDELQKSVEALAEYYPEHSHEHKR